MTGRWFSPITSTNKTDRQDITELLLKVALNTINQIILLYKEIHMYNVTSQCHELGYFCVGILFWSFLLEQAGLQVKGVFF